MSQQRTTRLGIIPSVLAVWLAFHAALEAQPRLMTDAEMDQVCAKGTTGMDVDPVMVRDMVFQFHQQTSIGLVTASGTVRTEVIQGGAQQPQVSISGQPVTTSVGSSAATVATDLQTVTINVVGGTIRVSGDVNVNVQALPGALRAIDQNRLVLPSGFISSLGSLQGVGGAQP